MIRKTNKRKTNYKRNTNRRINKRKTIRRRKGGSNNNNINYNTQFQARRIRLMVNLREVLEEMEEEINAGVNEINETTFVDRIREFESEADEIDHYFGNHEMEELLNQTMDDIMERLGMINNEIQNNNNTLSIISGYNIKNKNNNKNNNNNNKNWNM